MMTEGNSQSLAQKSRGALQIQVQRSLFLPHLERSSEKRRHLSAAEPNMKPLILLSFLLLLMAVVQGLMTTRRGRCLCIGPGMPAVHPKRVAKVEIYGPSNSCDHIEVIVTLKGKGQKCLNNKSPQAWQMIQIFMKKSNNKAQRK